MSISRTSPTHTATPSSTGAVTSSTSSSVSGSRTSAYSSRARGQAAISIFARPTIIAGRVSPVAAISAAASSARGTQRAASRSSAESRRLRLESARPSASRTVDTPTISMPKSRSAAIRRTTASCCQSFSPKTARCGRTAWKSFVTTVVTPRKCPGRVFPQSGTVSAATSTAVWKPSGYMARGLGAKITSTPAAAQRAASSSSVRG